MNVVYLTLVIAALAAVELLIGGTRLLFSLPSYGLLAMASVLTLFSFRKPAPPVNVFCLLGSGVFFGYVLLRIVLSPVEYLARPDLFAVLGALMVYLLFALYLTTPRQRAVIVVALLALALLQVGVGIVQAVKRENFTLFSFIEPASYGIRARGLYICPDHLAGFLEMVAMLGISLAFWSRWKLGWKLFAGYVVLMCLLGVALTGSRGGYLSTAFGLLVFAVLSLMTLRQAVPERFGQVVLTLAVLGGIFLGGVAYLLSHQETVRARAADLFDRQGGRLVLWDAALKQTGLSPGLGTGSGTFEIYGRQFRAPHLTAELDYVHNDYLQLLAEYGAAGTLAFVFFFLAHLRHAGKSFHWFVTGRREELGRIRSDALALNLGAFSAVAALAAHSVVDFNLHIPANALVLAFAFALLANPGVAPPLAENEFVGASRWARLALPALGLGVIVAGLPTLPAEYFAEQARVSMRDSRFDTAVERARQGLLWDKRNYNLHLYLGQAHFALGEAATDPKAAQASFTAAIESFRAGLALYPQEKWLLLGAGWALDALHRPAEAEDYFKKAIIWDPKSPQVHAIYALHLEQAGRLAEAREQFQKSVALRWTPAAWEGLQRLAKQ